MRAVRHELEAIKADLTEADISIMKKVLKFEKLGKATEWPDEGDVEMPQVAIRERTMVSRALPQTDGLDELPDRVVYRRRISPGDDNVDE